MEQHQLFIAIQIAAIFTCITCVLCQIFQAFLYPCDPHQVLQRNRAAGVDLISKHGSIELLASISESSGGASVKENALPEGSAHWARQATVCQTTPVSSTAQARLAVCMAWG
jgi:hypothetical protein